MYGLEAEAVISNFPKYMIEVCRTLTSILLFKSYINYYDLLQAYAQTDRVEKILTPEDLIRATKPLTMATGKAVAAGNSGKQDDVIVIANQGRKAIRDMLYTCKV